MAVTANQTIKVQDPGRLRHGLMIDNIKLYAGTMCFVVAASGHVTDAIAAGANKFMGIVKDFVDNTLTGHVAGGKTVEFYTSGAFLLVGTGFAQSSVGDKVYAADNYVLSLTSTNQTLVGTITEYVDSTHVYVEIDPQLP